MSIWKSFVTSLYSPSRMAVAIQHKKRRALTYLSFLLLISCLPFALMVGIVFQGQTNVIIEYINHPKMPDFTLDRGTIESARQDAATFAWKGLVVVFDPNETLTPTQSKPTKQTLIISKNQLILHDSKNQQVIDLKKIPVLKEQKLSKQQLLESVRTWRWPVFVAISVFLFQLYYLMLIVITILLLFIGIGLNIMLQHRMKMSRIWVFSCYAVTTPTVISGVLNTIGYNAPFGTFSFIVYFIVSCYILFLILREASYRSSID
jgi:hypothetical protein